MTYEIGPRPRPVFFGLALITVGVLFLLREVGAVPDISFWTLLWLGIGGWLFVGTLAGRRRKGWFWPLTLLAIGVFMLLRDLDVIPGDSSVWPVVIIAIGLSLVLEARGSRRRDGDIEVFGPGT
ncbi:MAG: DUF5668 domain-containing protein [Acidimicrobiia bacterium]|nr:DUF5668 domain-containing protein [Acidimicrobiia bacterium]